MRLQAHLLVKHEQHQQHLQPNMNGQVAFSCPVCDEGFIRPDQLIAHVHVHGPAAKIYKCSQCPAAFVFKSQLINHSFSHQQHHHHYQQINKASSFQANMNLIRSPADKPVQLSSHYLNRAVQNSQNSIMQQLQPHINSNLRMTVQSSNLNYSNNPSSNRTQYQNQINENRNNSIAHNDNSNNLMNYDPGDNLLPNQYIVNDNNIDGSKTYTCLTCSKTFNTPRNLSVHMRIHTGYRPFECNVCKRTFTSIYFMRKKTFSLLEKKSILFSFYLKRTWEPTQSHEVSPERATILLLYLQSNISPSFTCHFSPGSSLQV